MCIRDSLPPSLPPFLPPFPLFRLRFCLPFELTSQALKALDRVTRAVVTGTQVARWSDRSTSHGTS
eukprot:2143136-Rhodomonas_salina.1